eukprot:CAMPEP_0197286092 /NCGR_PEP_ID=MMETSP0890-20130614/1532_1 /TAXON_ID=44058 ORGANISM="Aureoumbra lagunensis, Strain CCMP1510" /NCGR_SAMPLE_ID=MMETSP0890 /ASSEMBLY_ACC=CAM_ASM_000533 /LENGTH=720 /DNA_ID=CAMNT_0042754193 /DNA_START=67 /DNA_END=2229 /DNA_ORIENTATION=-
MGTCQSKKSGDDVVKTDDQAAMYNQQQAIPIQQQMIGQQAIPIQQQMIGQQTLPIQQQMIGQQPYLSVNYKDQMGNYSIPSQHMIYGQQNQETMMMQASGQMLPSQQVVPPQVLNGATTIPQKDLIATESEFVAAIDFGTSNSGIAYSVGQGFNTVNNRAYAKRPTKLCVDMSTLSLVCMGEDAYKRAEDDPAYAVFERFKLSLNEDNGGATQIKGWFAYPNASKHLRQTLSVFELITLVLKVLKEELVEYVARFNSTRSAENCTWVLTVPICWGEPAKDVMEQAAISAGLVRKETLPYNLVIALEPEAALIGYFHREEAGMTSWGHLNEQHRRFMVVDNGGGTFDVCVVKVNSLNPFSISEVVQGAGGPWGATKVDEELLNFLRVLLGPERYKQFEASDKTDVLERWERYKMTFDGNDQGDSSRLAFKFFLYNVGDDLSVCECVKAFQDTEWGNPHELQAVNTESKRLTIPVTYVKAFFDKVLLQILSGLKVELSACAQHGEHVTDIVLAGGFSESAYLQATIQRLFQGTGVLFDIPDTPGMCILQGAVKYGKNPQMVAARAMRYAYGIGVQRPLSLISPEEQHLYAEGNLSRSGDFYMDVFKKFVQVGDIISTSAPPIQIELGTLNNQEGFVQIYHTANPAAVFVWPKQGVFPLEGTRVDTDDPAKEVANHGVMSMSRAPNVAKSVLLEIWVAQTRIHMVVRSTYNSKTKNVTASLKN